MSVLCVGGGGGGRRGARRLRCLVGDKVDVRLEIVIVQPAEEAAAEQLVVRGEPLEAEKV